MMLLGVVAALLPLLELEGQIRLGWKAIIFLEIVLLVAAAVMLWVAYQASASV